MIHSSVTAKQQSFKIIFYLKLSRNIPVINKGEENMLAPCYISNDHGVLQTLFGFN